MQARAVQRRHASRPGRPLWSLRTDVTGCASGSLFAVGAVLPRQTRWPLRAGCAGLTSGTSLPLRTGDAADDQSARENDNELHVGPTFHVGTRVTVGTAGESTATDASDVDTGSETYAPPFNVPARLSMVMPFACAVS